MIDTRERQLWAAVMELAWQDATGHAASSEKEPAWMLKAHAQRWFERAEGTFPIACQALGLDVEAVQDRYRAAMAAQKAAEELAKATRRSRKAVSA